MIIKIAVVLLVIVCLSGPIIQTLRFRKFRQGTPWRIPALWTQEGIGWDLVGSSLIGLVGQGGLVVMDHTLVSQLGPISWPAGVRLAGCIIGMAGAGIAFWSQSQMGASWRVGTDPEGQRDLVTSGVFRYVRNPIYLGLLMQIAGAAILLPTFLSALCVSAGVLGLNLVVNSEERFLIARYGQDYRDYLERTGRFLPRLGSPR